MFVCPESAPVYRILSFICLLFDRNHNSTARSAKPTIGPSTAPAIQVLFQEFES
jgi:hypothetical protein